MALHQNREAHGRLVVMAAAEEYRSLYAEPFLALELYGEYVLSTRSLAVVYYCPAIPREGAKRTVARVVLVCAVQVDAASDAIERARSPKQVSTVKLTR